MKRKFALFIALTFSLAISLNGCTFSTSIDTLLSPPKLTSQQEKIYEALTNSVGENIDLQYPKSGDNLSAFTIADLDGDGTDEALVLYCYNKEDELRMNVLDETDGKWLSVSDLPAAGTEIEKIDIKPLGEAGNINIVIGYTVTSGAGKTVAVYQYKNSSLGMAFSSTYDYYYTDDFDGDEKNEIFMIQNITNTEEKSKAVMYEIDIAGLYHPHEVELNSLASDCAKISFGTLYDGSNGIYIDESVGTSIIQTEILKVYKNGISAMKFDVEKTKRSSGYLSIDIDGDDTIETPIQNELFPGYSETDSDKIYITSWLTMSKDGLMEKYSGYYSLSSGMAFMIPSSWDGKVTCVSDPIREEILFKKFNGTIENSTDVLLCIAPSKSEEQAEDFRTDGYSEVNTVNGLYYLIYIPETDDILSRTEGLITGNLYFVS